MRPAAAAAATARIDGLNRIEKVELRGAAASGSAPARSTTGTNLRANVTQLAAARRRQIVRFESRQRFARKRAAHVAIDEVLFDHAQPRRDLVVHDAGFVEALGILRPEQAQQVTDEYLVIHTMATGVSLNSAVHSYRTYAAKSFTGPGDSGPCTP